MTTPTIETWYYVQIVLKSLVDGSTTKTVKLSNRPMIDEADGSTIYFPILKQLNNIGSQMGDYIPNRVSGSIVLDNSPSSFGFDRKFSDLLERYTILGQPVTIYSAYTTLDDTTINAEFALDWTTTGLTWEIRGDDLIIQVAEQSLSTQVLTKAVDPTTFPSAPAASIGKFLPMVFGDAIPVRPILTTDSTTPIYSYGTNFGTSFVNSGVSAYSLRNSNGTYSTITNPAATTTAIFQNTSEDTSSVLASVDVAYGLAAPSSTCYALRGGKLMLTGNSTAGTTTGYLLLKLVEANPANNTTPDDVAVVATATVNKADYSANYQSAAVDFYVEFSFNRVAVLRPNIQYYLIIQGSNELTASRSFVRYNSTGGTGGGVWQRTVPSSDGSSWSLSSSTAKGCMEFYAVRFDDSPSGGAADASGLGYSYVTLSQKTAATGQTNPSLTNLDHVYLVNGIADDGSGTITGSAGATVRAPQHVIRALDLQWNGSTWSTTGAVIDTTRFTTALTAHGETSSGATTKVYPRQIGGYSEGRKTAADLMRDVCRSSAHRISRYNGATKPFTLWAWGSTQQSVATISDEDSTLTSVRQIGAESVVNRAVINYLKDSRNSDVVTAAAQGRIAGYDYVNILDGASTTAAAYGLNSSTSINLFGRRELADIYFDWISANQTNYADSMAQFYLRVYPFPFVYAELEVPMFKYRTLEIFDVIEIVHPGLPSYFGSTSNARLPYYSGAVTDLCAGQYWKRGKRYRAQIEGKTLNYNLSGFPTIKLNCRLLLNTGIDPT